MVARRAVLRIALDVLIAAVAMAFDLTVYLDRDGGGLRTGGFGEAVSITLIAIGGVALIFRRRYPMTVFVIVWCVAFSSILAPDLQPIAILLVGLYSAAVAASRQSAVLALVAVLAATTVMSVNTAPTGDSAWGPWLLTTLVANVAVPCGVWFFGRMRNRAVAREERMLAEHRDGLERAMRDERRRLGRELHDIVSHTVSVMTLQAAGARALMEREPERVGPALGVIEAAGVQAMNELQRLLGVLRAEGIEPLAPHDQPPATLENLIELARSSGQHVELVVSGSRTELDPSVELACYRVVQESLTNARKYAGAGAQVQITMEWLPPKLKLSVLNEPGDPGDQPSLSTGNGLAGLTERVQLIGGDLTADPLPGGGFRVNAVLPVTPVRTDPEPS